MGNKNSKDGDNGKNNENNNGDNIIAQAPMKENAKMTPDDFELVSTIGKGSFGCVYEVRHKATGKVYAMKVLKKEQVMAKKQYEHTLAERRIMADISHPFIVCLRYAFQTRSKLYLVSDFFNGGELYFYLSNGRFSENRARFYAAEIACGLAHLHDHGIVYRDLKPENLLLDADGHIRITDFGLSKENVEGDTVRSICGTPEYLAPEVLNKKPYGKAVDWWSLGTLIFEMITGLPPFYDSNRKIMYHKILNAPLIKPAGMSAEAFDICSKLLNRNPEERLGHDGVEGIKNHPFFKTIDWEKLVNLQVTPPFKPKVTSAESTENVDYTFTSELPFISATAKDAVIPDENAFDGFSYNPNIMH